MLTNNDIIYNLTKKILSDCKANSIDIRLFGSVALLFLEFERNKSINGFYRGIADIDIIVRPNHIEALESYFINQNYEANRRIKMLYGNQRRSFRLENGISIDVFIGNITLCQDISILDRFDLSYPTIPPVDLFLSKIQKIKLSEKDISDIKFILDYMTDSDCQYIIKLSSKDWNWWKSLTTNISELLKKDINENNKKRLNNLLIGIDSSDKTISWKTRNIIGGKWYNDVE